MESFVASDLVAYIDAHYRTIANRESRGVSGHSMGGYGTMRIGMKHSEIFGSLYAMSSCCLMNDPAQFRDAVLGALRERAASDDATPPERELCERAAVPRETAAFLLRGARGGERAPTSATP